MFSVSRTLQLEIYELVEKSRVLLATQIIVPVQTNAKNQNYICSVVPQQLLIAQFNDMLMQVVFDFLPLFFLGFIFLGFTELVLIFLLLDLLFLQLQLTFIPISCELLGRHVSMHPTFFSFYKTLSNSQVNMHLCIRHYFPFAEIHSNSFGTLILVGSFLLIISYHFYVCYLCSLFCHLCQMIVLFLLH